MRKLICLIAFAGLTRAASQAGYRQARTGKTTAGAPSPARCPLK